MLVAVRVGLCPGPVPTQSGLEGRGAVAGKTIEYLGCDENCARLRPWIKQAANQQKVEAWLEKHGGAIAIADFLTGDYAGLRQGVVTELIEASP